MADSSSPSTKPIRTADVKQEVAIRMGKQGIAAAPAQTVMDFWDAAVKERGDKPALHQKVMKKGAKAVDTPWTTWTWKEYRGEVDAFAKALLSLGVEKFDMINIIGFNAPEWLFANYGAIAAGCVPAGIYTTNHPEACKYIGAHSKAKVIVVEGIEQLKKYYEITNDLPDLKALVVYGGDELPADIKTKCAVQCYTYKDFVQKGKNDTTLDALLKERSTSWKPGETCTLIYTSGTTGPPKAVMITNDNITWTCKAMIERHPDGKMTNDDHMISYLPLSHIAAQMLDMHIPLYQGVQIHFAQPDALKGSIGATLKDVRPTVFFGVPRVWEKIYDKLQEVAKSSTGIKKMLSTWAKSKALEYWESREFGQKVYTPFLLFLARTLLGKAHVALGFDRCRAFFVSAAPIEVKILKYFTSLDVPIMELFGQSECTGPHAINSVHAFKIGTVGRPMTGTETKLGDGDELCYRGRHIFAGYMGMPEQTNATIDDDGWLHSGDVVAIDDDHCPDIVKPSGFIKITGRIKELIITAGGENVPPVLIEDALKAAMPAISNAMVIGDKRKFLSVLICLQVEIDIETGEASNKLTGAALDAAKAMGSKATTTEEAMGDPLWQKYFAAGVAQANEKAVSRAQQINEWRLLPTDFTEKGGELTPTLKLKRSVTATKYSDVIEAIYDAEAGTQRAKNNKSNIQRENVPVVAETARDNTSNKDDDQNEAIC